MYTLGRGKWHVYGKKYFKVCNSQNRVKGIKERGREKGYGGWGNSLLKLSAGDAAQWGRDQGCYLMLPISPQAFRASQQNNSQDQRQCPLCVRI